jgi:hypothetical protein
MALAVVMAEQMAETAALVAALHRITPLEVTPEALVIPHLYLHLRVVMEVTPHLQQINLRLVAAVALAL